MINTKQRVAFWSAVALFVIAILCAIESMTGGAPAYKALAVGALVLATIFSAGVWALGLPKSTDPDNKDWSDAIR